MALAELGVFVDDLAPAAMQSAGVVLFEGSDRHGPLLVKVYGRDAWDAQLLTSLWRMAWYRGGERERRTEPGRPRRARRFRHAARRARRRARPAAGDGRQRRARRRLGGRPAGRSAPGGDPRRRHERVTPADGRRRPAVARPGQAARRRHRPPPARPRPHRHPPRRLARLRRPVVGVGRRGTRRQVQGSSAADRSGAAADRRGIGDDDCPRRARRRAPRRGPAVPAGGGDAAAVAGRPRGRGHRARRRAQADGRDARRRRSGPDQAPPRHVGLDPQPRAAGVRRLRPHRLARRRRPRDVRRGPPRRQLVVARLRRRPRPAPAHPVGGEHDGGDQPPVAVGSADGVAVRHLLHQPRHSQHGGAGRRQHPLLPALRRRPDDGGVGRRDRWRVRVRRPDLPVPRR